MGNQTQHNKVSRHSIMKHQWCFVWVFFGSALAQLVTRLQAIQGIVGDLSTTTNCLPLLRQSACFSTHFHCMIQMLLCNSINVHTLRQILHEQHKQRGCMKQFGHKFHNVLLGNIHLFYAHVQMHTHTHTHTHRALKKHTQMQFHEITSSPDQKSSTISMCCVTKGWSILTKFWTLPRTFLVLGTTSAVFCH